MFHGSCTLAALAKTLTYPALKVCHPPDTSEFHEADKITWAVKSECSMIIGRSSL